MTNKYAWQSPYAVFNNNPIWNNDPFGLEAENATPPEKTKWEKKFDRKFSNWQRKNQQSIIGLNRLEQYEMFKNSPIGGGRTIAQTNWFRKYEEHQDISGKTWQDISTHVPSVVLKPSSKATYGSYTETYDIETSTGTMTITYDMYEEADRLQVINPNTGDILFDTRNIAGSDFAGRVAFKNGSGAVINFNLGDGNNQLQVVINGPAPASGATQFGYEIVLSNIPIKVQSVINTKPDTKRGRPRYKRRPRN